MEEKPREGDAQPNATKDNYVPSGSGDAKATPEAQVTYYRYGSDYNLYGHPSYQNVSQALVKAMEGAARSAAEGAKSAAETFARNLKEVMTPPDGHAGRENLRRKRSLLFRMAEMRGYVLQHRNFTAIEGADEAQLDVWISRFSTATSVDEIFRT